MKNDLGKHLGTKFAAKSASKRKKIGQYRSGNGRSPSKEPQDGKLEAPIEPKRVRRALAREQMEPKRGATSSGARTNERPDPFWRDEGGETAEESPPGHDERRHGVKSRACRN